MTEIKYTHQTRSRNYLARIIATDLKNGQCPVVVALKAINEVDEHLALYSPNLTRYGDEVSDLDLVEYNMWEDVAVDTKILVRDFDTNDWIPRYFSHYADGRAHAFAEGRTSWTKRANDPTNSWDQSKLAE